MAAPTVYSSTDVGAPVLNAGLGSLIGLLDAVLVNGYGSKASLGWTKEFSGTYKAVYRPAAGARLFYRFDDSVGSLGTSYTYFDTSMYDSMSSIDDGLGFSGISRCLRTTLNELASTPRAWVIIGDSSGFFLRAEYHGGLPYKSPRLWYFGEGIPLSSSDYTLNVITGTITSGGGESLGTTDKGFNTSGVGQVIRVHKSSDGATFGVFSSLRGVAPTAGYMIGSSNIPASMNYPFDGKLLYIRPFLNGSTTIDVRGFLPGLYAPLHFTGLVEGTVYTEGTKQLLYLIIAIDYSVGGVLIDIGEGFR